MRILVVEPDPVVRHYVDVVLTRLGFHTLIAPSPDAANALLLDFPSPPDVALVDISHSAQRGFGYSDELLRRYPSVTPVFMGSWQSDEDSAEARRRGALLYKPFYARELVDAVRFAASRP
jgi:DNA-binding response OmpR family regulator